MLSPPGWRATCQAALVIAALFMSGISCAQDVGGLRELTRPEDALGMPSASRVVGVLVLMIALAFAALYAVRKWQPTIESRFGTGRSIKVLERTLVGGVRVYLLQVGEQRVLLSEHRGRTTMLLLPAGAAPTNPQS